MKRGRTAGSGLVKAAQYTWGVYSRFIDRLESVFLQSLVIKFLRKAADILSASVEGSFLASVSRPLNGCVYSGSVLIGSIKRPFRRAESRIGAYYEESGFRRIASEIEALFVRVDKLFSGSGWKTLKDNSKMIGMLRRCSGKK